MKTAHLSLSKSKRRSDRRKLIFVWGMLALPLIQFFVFFIYVNFSSIVLSFQNSSGQFTTYNYELFFRELTTNASIKNATFYSLLVGANDVVLVLISTILSYFMFKKIKGKSFFRVVFFLPSIISITIYVLVYKYMLRSDVGLAGKLIPDWGWLTAGTSAFKFTIPMYCLWVGTGYNILIIGGAMSNVPQEVLENAKLEGVSMKRELFQIIIPMIWPTLCVAFLGSVTTIFTLFVQVKLITGGVAGTSTIAFFTNNLVTDGTYYNYACAVGIMFTVVAIPLVLLAKKGMDKLGKRWGY